MSAALVEVIEAGRVPYALALGWQRALAQARIDGRLPHDVLLLLEHPPVVTLGRAAHAANVLRPDGLEVCAVERGGDVTYHGPGQLVGYPILDLGGYRRDLHWYLRTLERALITALGQLGLSADERPGYTGVWIGARKIASIGVHVKQWVTWHGFALNVTTDPADFDRIVPCGLPGVVMTSVARELERKGDREGAARAAATGAAGALWERAVSAVLRGFEGAFQVAARPAALATLALPGLGVPPAGERSGVPRRQAALAPSGGAPERHA